MQGRGRPVLRQIDSDLKYLSFDVLYEVKGLGMLRNLLYTPLCDGELSSGERPLFCQNQQGLAEARVRGCEQYLIVRTREPVPVAELEGEEETTWRSAAAPLSARLSSEVKIEGVHQVAARVREQGESHRREPGQSPLNDLWKALKFFPGSV